MNANIWVWDLLIFNFLPSRRSKTNKNKKNSARNNMKNKAKNKEKKKTEITKNIENNKNI
jgi:hypothetical protein